MKQILTLDNANPKFARFILWVTILMVVCPPAVGGVAAVRMQSIPLDHPGIVVYGTPFSHLEEDGLHFERFDKTILRGTPVRAKVNPERARNTSGVVLVLTSAAPVIRLSFGYDPADHNRGSQFGIYRDREWVAEVSAGKQQQEVMIDLSRGSDTEQVVRHEVVLPSWSNPILRKVEIPESFSLLPDSKKLNGTIVFLGDSISHGTGQGSASYKNYPFIAARKLGMEGLNLAVGGGKISPPVADLLQHFGPVELIWILVGYNNWQGASQELPTIRKDYQELLDTVRRHQPNAEVFCCTLTYTRREVDAESGVTASEVRDAVADVVNHRMTAGDQRLHLVRAETLSSEANLRPTSDPVHFSEEGAALFAEAVVRVIRNQWGRTSVIRTD